MKVIDMLKRSGITTKKDINKVISEYKSYGLNWNLDSMLFINDNNITSLQIYNGDDFKAFLVMVQAGTKEHSITEAKAIFDKWQSLGYGFRVLRSLCIEQMEKQGFFLGEAEKILLDELQTLQPEQNFIVMELMDLANMRIELRKRGKYLID